MGRAYEKNVHMRGVLCCKVRYDVGRGGVLRGQTTRLRWAALSAEVGPKDVKPKLCFLSACLPACLPD